MNLSKRQQRSHPAYSNAGMSGDFSNFNLADELGKNSAFKIFIKHAFFLTSGLYLVFNTLP